MQISMKRSTAMEYIDGEGARKSIKNSTVWV